MTPRKILLAGWALFLVYAYPGFLSFDSVVELDQARTGSFGGGHPAMMGVVWAICDNLIAGPLLMLLLQSGCFLGGAYLLLKRSLSQRNAAIAACVVLCFPPIAAVMAVVWKDAQMAGYAMLGTALLVSDCRRAKLGGLALIWLATAMRYNALALTFPLVVLLFSWKWTGWRRYAVSLFAWLAITWSARVVDQLIVTDEPRLWTSLAEVDLVGTIRNAPDLPDAELAHDLAGTPLLVTSNIQAATRATYPPTADRAYGGGSVTPALWDTTEHVFAPPATQADAEAIARAWKRVIPSHLGAYLAYRASVFREVVHFADGDTSANAYVAFIDINALPGRDLGHAAAPSKLQTPLRDGVYALGHTLLFHPWIYLALLVVAFPFVRTRIGLALALSGLANQTALFVLAPTVDYRYSFWLVVAAVVLAASARLKRR